MTTTLKVFSYLALSLGILVGVATPSAQAQLQKSRDYYRLDRNEQDFLKFDADWNAAPAGSQSELIADRARARAREEANREADYVFHRQADVDYRNTIARGLRYNQAFQAAKVGSVKEAFYKDMFSVSFEGIVTDVQELSRVSRFEDLLVPLIALEQGYQDAPAGSFVESLYLKTFNSVGLVVKDSLSYDVQRMSNRDLYDLERQLGDRYDRTNHRALQQFYSECLTIVRNANGGGGHLPPNPTPYPTPIPQDPPRAVALHVVGVSQSGTRVDTRGGQIELMRHDVIRLNTEILDQYGHILATPADLFVRVMVDSPKLKIRTLGSVVEMATGDAMTDGREVVIVQLQARSRVYNVTADLQVKVVKPAFRGFNAQLAEKVIRNLYQGILFRDAGWEGDSLATQIRALQNSGMRWLTGRAKDMAKSPEFATNVRGKHSDREILERLYVYLLGRGGRDPVDPSGYSSYLPQIAQGRVAEVVSALVNSQEAMDVVYNP